MVRSSSGHCTTTTDRLEISVCQSAFLARAPAVRHARIATWICSWRSRRRELRDLPVGKDIVITTLQHIAARGLVSGLTYKAAIEYDRVIYEHR